LKAKPAHAELVEARTGCGVCLDKLGMSGSVRVRKSRKICGEPAGGALQRRPPRL